MPGTNNRVNRQIRAREVRVISGDGEQLGIMSIEEALRKAEDQGLDLVEVAAVSRPPVCRIMDYGKFKYSQKKKQKGTRQASQQMKEVKLRPKTEEHDYQVKLKHVTRFLTEGHKVKITVRFRGREMAHKDIGLEMLNRISKDAGDLAVMAAPPLMEGRMLQMVLAPSPRALVIKRAKDEERAKLREEQALARKARADRGEPPLEEKEEEPDEEEEEEEDLDEGDDDEEEEEDGDDKEGTKE
jgi:translation initiation factor IF-3